MNGSEATIGCVASNCKFELFGDNIASSILAAPTVFIGGFMARSARKDQSITQKNDASSISNRRGMSRRAKRNSNKRDRQFLNKELRIEKME